MFHNSIIIFEHNRVKPSCKLTLNPEYTKAVQCVFCGLKIWKVKIIAYIAHCEYEARSLEQETRI
jgi:hypothetical protein